jgi:hypothetical protein
MSRTIALLVQLCVAGTCCLAHAQANDAALIATGARRDAVISSFTSFAPDVVTFDAPPLEVPAAITFVVTIDSDEERARVWRRRDGVTLERRIEASDPDGYSLALVASELLEVARSGADPALLGATIVAAPEPVASEIVQPPRVAPPAPIVAPIAPIASAASLALTIGLGAEAWLGLEEGSPWIVQGALFVELLARATADVWLGGALFASGLGENTFDTNGAEGSFARHDFGARVTIAGDAGPVHTRLLAHVRVGGSAVVGSAVRADERRSETVAAWFVGLGFEVRQPLIEGLELWLELAADLVPAPVRFTVLGAAWITEAPARLAGRLGAAWRLP